MVIAGAGSVGRSIARELLAHEHQVTLIDRRGRQAGATLSGDDGTYALAVPAEGPYVLAAKASGYGPLASSASHAGDDRAVDLDLSLPTESVTA